MSETVGVVGAGRMGLPIIGHLARAGFRTLATDVDSQKEPEVQRRAALWVPDAATLVRECDIVLVCVGFDREVRELLAPGGAFRSARRGSVCAVLSTIHPKTIQDLSGQNRAVGLEVIDSTVCRRLFRGRRPHGRGGIGAGGQSSEQSHHVGLLGRRP